VILEAAAAVVASLVIITGGAIANSPNDPPPLPVGQGTYAPAPPTAPFADTQHSGAFSGRDFFAGLNAALAARNHDAFFAFVTGDAVVPLQQWWTNMDAIGWSTAGISLGPASASTYADDQASLVLVLGAVTTFSPLVPIGGGSPDAGQSLPLGRSYRAGVSVNSNGAGGQITSWTPAEGAAPWDGPPLYVVKADRVVVAGLPDEQGVVDASVAGAEAAAEYALATYSAHVPHAAANGFLVFVTQDGDMFDSWLGLGTGGWEPAAVTFSMDQPSAGYGIDPTIQTSYDAFGSAITVGPGAYPYGGLTETLVHEMFHAMQMNDDPPSRSRAPASAIEGWARYEQWLYRDGGTFGVSRSTATDMRDCVATYFDGGMPSNNDIYDGSVDQGDCDYDISASAFDYVAIMGGDVYAVAQDSYTKAVDPIDAAIDLGMPLTMAAWAGWVRATW
jgi:hypothetical protein